MSTIDAREGYEIVEPAELSEADLAHVVGGNGTCNPEADTHCGGGSSGGDAG